MTYTIREVDGTDEDVVETLDFLHQVCFGNTAPKIDHSLSHRWWFAVAKGKAIAFGGFVPSRQYPKTAYMYRSGVLPRHRGKGLQKKLLRVREKAAKRIGWTAAVTDTSGNVTSSNNLIATGYHIFRPKYPWGFAEAIYWRKKFA